MARNKDTNQKMLDSRREQIMSNALKVFAVKGLSATKISDIAAASGFSQGLIYHYYRSKEELFIALVSHALERMNAACRYLESLEATPREKIIMAIEGLLRNLEENEDSARYYMLIAQASITEAIPDEAKRIIEEGTVVPYEVITKIMKEGQREGSVKKHDAAELALMFWTSIKGLAISKAVRTINYRTPDPAILTGMFLNEHRPLGPSRSETKTKKEGE
jgi:AcrR family transcriptional regulator